VAIVDGEHAIIAEANPAAFATAVCDLLDDKRASLSHRCGGPCVDAGRDYDWAHIAPRLLAVYERLERSDD